VKCLAGGELARRINSYHALARKGRQMSISRTHALSSMAGAVAASLIGRTAAAQTVAHIRLAMVPVENAAQAYYAIEQGFFQGAGLNVEIQPISNAPAIVSAIVGDVADIGFSTVGPLALAHLRGLPVAFVAAAHVSDERNPTGALVVASDSPIQRAADLTGKIIAANGLATPSEYIPRAWVDRNGGDASTLRFVEMPFSEMPAALAAGRIDAAQISEPFMTEALQQHHARILVYAAAVTKDALQGGWFTTLQWARAHGAALKRFNAAMRQTAAWANANPALCVPILVKYLKVDPQVATMVHRAKFAERLSAAKVQPMIDLSAKYAKFKPFPARDLIYVPS
jgi:NitT/TauT family transport system substrate-binding protein